VPFAFISQNLWW